MASNRVDDTIEGLALLALGYLIVRELLENPLTHAEQALEHKGAQLYETLHPKERAHADDLPGPQWNRAKLLELMKRHGFPDPELAVAIVLAESGGVPGAITRSSRENSIGLFQINVLAHPEYSVEELKDPDVNAKAALKISRQGLDWRPWSVWWADANKRQGPGEGRFRDFLP